jgi:hypothetical protein
MITYLYPPTSVSVSFPAGASTEAKQDAILVELQATELLTGAVIRDQTDVDNEVSLGAVGAQIPLAAKENGMLFVYDMWTQMDVNNVYVQTLAIKNQIGPLTATKEINPDAASASELSLLRGILKKQIDTITELELKANLNETQPVSAASLPLPIGAAAEVTLEAARVLLASLDSKDFATQTTIALMKTALDSLLTGEGAVADAAVSNPASSGSMIALLKGILTLITSTNTKIDTLDTNTSPKTPSYQEIVNLTNVAQTFVAPAGAVWCKIQADDTNAANIRVKLGGVATASSGLQFQPGRSEDYQAVDDISVICESADTNQKVYVQFGA